MRETLFDGVRPIASGIENIISQILCVIEDEDITIKAGCNGIYINGQYYYVSCDTGYGELNHWLKHNGYEQYHITDEYYAYEPEVGDLTISEIDDLLELEIIRFQEKGEQLSQQQVEEQRQYYLSNLGTKCNIQAVYMNNKIVGIKMMHNGLTDLKESVYIIPDARNESIQKTILEMLDMSA